MTNCVKNIVVNRVTVHIDGEGQGSFYAVCSVLATSGEAFTFATSLPWSRTLTFLMVARGGDELEVEAMPAEFIGDSSGTPRFTIANVQRITAKS